MNQDFFESEYEDEFSKIGVTLTKADFKSYEEHGETLYSYHIEGDFYGHLFRVGPINGVKESILEYITPDRDVNNVVEFLEHKIESGKLESTISNEEAKRIFESYKESKLC